MAVALQLKTLRDFAGKRDWKLFHLPKDLATAFLSTDLSWPSSFEWIWPEQFVAAPRDPVA